ncbi:MAG: hypothetical protein AAGA20_12760 [Planctomycetota bacterium]
MRIAHAAAVGVALWMTLFGGHALAGEPPTSSTSCQHVGTKWVNQRVSQSGGTQCPEATFKLTVGFDGAGAQISMTFNGCPTFLIFQPGHNAQVPKVHYFVGNQQKVYWWKQTYNADCGGWFRGPKCIPAEETTTTSQFATSWTEFACVYH